jgi:hypothetical protein
VRSLDHVGSGSKVSADTSSSWGIFSRRAESMVSRALDRKRPTLNDELHYLFYAIGLRAV